MRIKQIEFRAFWRQHSARFQRIELTPNGIA
jgi:hypothetical protein